MLSKEDTLLEQASVTCKLCDAKFESMGDMQYRINRTHAKRRLPNSIRKTEIVILDKTQ